MMPTDQSADIRETIIQALLEQGFNLEGKSLSLPGPMDKERLRQLHFPAVQHRIDIARKAFAGREDRLLGRLASGANLVPERVSPRLVEVLPGSEDELLFRYARLHWSVPVSSGYGRRLRFLVIDEQNDKLMGLIGLGDPVFSLAPRDKWVGWDNLTRKLRLSHVLDAFVLGAVPPYTMLLCGKLIAMLATSNESRVTFEHKYLRRVSLIRGRELDASVALITTLSALGRSSIYNRLRYHERLVFESVGFTQGSGEFHFSNGLYATVSKYAADFCKPTAKDARWGRGFRSRREVVKKCLLGLGLPAEWLYHGIRREIFVAPLALNARGFLIGADSRPHYHNQPVRDLFAFFRERWLLPRSRWDVRYQGWNPQAWRLWPK